MGVATALSLAKVRLAIAGEPRVVLTGRRPGVGDKLAGCNSRGIRKDLARLIGTGSSGELRKKDLPLKRWLEVRT